MRRLNWILCILPVMLVASAAAGAEVYHMVRVKGPSDDVVKTMALLGLPLDDAKKTGEDLDIPLKEEDITLLDGSKIAYEIVQEDLGLRYRTVCRRNLQNIIAGRVPGVPIVGALGNPPGNMEYGSMGGFYNYDEILAELDQMRSLYPDLITARASIGKTNENRDIWMVKISDNADTDEDEPECLID